MSGRCQDCKWFRCSEWTKHAKPRIANGARLTCEWPVPIITVSKSVQQSFGYRPVFTGNYADPNWTDCPTFEAK